MKPNLKFEEWHAVDRLLIGWLCNTMMVDVRSQLLHCHFAQVLWEVARSLSGASTRAHVMVFKTKLHHTQKNGMKMEEYLSKMKHIADQLAFVGSPVDYDNLMTHTPNSLDHKYNTIVIKLIDQPNLTWVDAQATFLALETRLDQLNQFANPFIQSTMNVANRNEDRDSHFASRDYCGHG
ncbi:uncharacterized protein LOC129286996 [Prosopis cineraria]|uniref:uncharacterized protein LOC129286996 n=1 Tax=Prosopis cineraria TaxID=364024 RepID=UPI00240FEB9F|nr:uncharacterized protein LOC129286996 [Prosopis cineraria]XP_054779090.1 uncharacterized protein LOC129286996 [Prosopis cineraria]